MFSAFFYYYYERLELLVAIMTVVKSEGTFSEQDGSHPVERDLNSDNDRTSSQEDLSCGSKPESDWLTVNKEDVGSPTSSSS
jgi:hypothetical protein